jgi:hypothetical protein
MFEAERPVQSESLGRGVEMAGYSSSAVTWLLALAVFALLIAGFVWMSSYNASSGAAQSAHESPRNTYPPVASP